ncbi:hypothetical protein [Streptomyces stackebrandtii]|uniref:hypothetical protein n=1 Tax=Streptomyces stackebrandtii TaxID=3051177 RepID=UPI0037DA734E
MAGDQPGPDRAADSVGGDDQVSVPYAISDGDADTSRIAAVDGLVFDRLINGGPVTEKEIATLVTAALH